MKYLLVTMFFTGTLSCQLLDFSNHEQKNANQLFSEKKAFLHSFAFSGHIQEKRYCVQCSINKFTLLIKLNSYKKVEFSDLQYQPYFFFQGDSIILISVSKQIFEYSKENSFVQKEANSDYLTVQDTSLMLLSKNEKEWLPND